MKRRSRLAKFQGNLFRKKYREVLEEKNRLIDNYRHATDYAEDLTALRDDDRYQEARGLRNSQRHPARRVQGPRHQVRAGHLGREEERGGEAREAAAKPSRHRGPPPVSLGIRVRRDPQQTRRLRRDHDQSAVGDLQAQRQRVLRRSLRRRIQEEYDDSRVREGAGEAA